MQVKTLTFIGAGNMASCLIAGLCADGYDPSALRATDPSAERLEALAQRFNITTSTDNTELVRGADVVVLAVKPDKCLNVLAEIRDLVCEQGSLVMSVAAGVNLSQLLGGLQADKHSIVRCMPNTPAMVGAGASVLFANSHADEAQRNLAESVMRVVGTVTWAASESQLNAMAALSGCGPAYCFRFMEAFHKAAVHAGIEEKQATELIIQTVLGATKLALESEQNFVQLRRQVASPGGMTEQGLQVLEDAGIDDMLQRVFSAAFEHASHLEAQCDTGFDSSEQGD